MNNYDFFTAYKYAGEDIINKTNKLNEHFIQLKFGYVLDKSNELNNFKKYIKSSNKTYSLSNINQIKQISGIFNENELNKIQNYIQKLPKYSFAIWLKFELTAPYFSKDDDEFYIVQNPVLKETNFKVPMIRGSGWKGALARAFRELFKEDFEKKKEKIKSFLRVFGAGSESIKAIESYIFDKSKDLEKAKDKLLEFMLFELGLEVNSDLIKKIKDKGTDNKDKLLGIIKEKLYEKLENNQQNLPLELQTHKGRAIFYPTYFNKLSLEIINPHDRRKRAGTNPIHYEVVPKGTEAIFQLIYIPFDGILKDEGNLKKEVKEDLENLCRVLEILSKKGIGAKTKLGWGRFEIKDKKVCLNSDLEIPEGWKECQD